MVATSEDGKGAVIVEKKSSDRGKRCIKIKRRGGLYERWVALCASL